MLQRVVPCIPLYVTSMPPYGPPAHTTALQAPITAHYNQIQVPVWSYKHKIRGTRRQRRQRRQKQKQNMIPVPLMVCYFGAKAVDFSSDNHALVVNTYLPGKYCVGITVRGVIIRVRVGSAKATNQNDHEITWQHVLFVNKVVNSQPCTAVFRLWFPFLSTVPRLQLRISCANTASIVLLSVTVLQV